MIERQKTRSIIDTLMILQVKIFHVWGDKKVFSLVTFDIKGAFNRVVGDVFLEKLCRCCILEILVH